MKGCMIRSAGRGGAVSIVALMLSVVLLVTLHLPPAFARAEEIEIANFMEAEDQEAEYAEQVEAEVDEIEDFQLSELGVMEIVEGLFLEDDAEDKRRLETDTNPVVMEAAMQSEEVHAVEKFTAVEGAACWVIVRYTTDSIPEDAELTAMALTDSRYADCAESMRAAVGNGADEHCEVCMMALSLVSGGIDYASTCCYEVEIVMDQPMFPNIRRVQAMRFDDGDPTPLKSRAKAQAGEGIEKVTFNAEGI